MSASLSPISVILVEDHAGLSRELSQWITATAGLRHFGVFGSGEELLDHFPDPAPDVALVDLRLPGISGVDLIREMRQRHPGVQCLVLTMYAESELIFEAVKAGACGYLLKRTPLPEIADAIRQVHAGGSVMTPRIARRVLEMFAAPAAAPVTPSLPPGPEPHPALTEREVRVLQHMVQGQARKQITQDLGINSHTLDYVIRCIYRKLQVQSLAGAVSVAVRDGIVNTPR
jgi:DNA-binding NarL/FixJ family response regulator